MPINVSPITATATDADGREVIVRIYYDDTIPYDPPNQALVNGPRGYCLDLTNVSGRQARIDVTLPDGTTTTVLVGQGDPVTTGPANGRSRTAAQMAALGFTTRASVAGLSIR